MKTRHVTLDPAGTVRGGARAGWRAVLPLALGVTLLTTLTTPTLSLSSRPQGSGGAQSAQSGPPPHPPGSGGGSAPGAPPRRGGQANGVPPPPRKGGQTNGAPAPPRKGPRCRRRCWYRLHIGTIVAGTQGEYAPSEALVVDPAAPFQWFQTKEDASYELNSLAFIVSQDGGPATVRLVGLWRTYTARADPLPADPYWDLEKHKYVGCKWPAATAHMVGHPALVGALDSAPHAPGQVDLSLGVSLQPGLAHPGTGHLVDGFWNDATPLYPCGPQTHGLAPRLQAEPTVGVFGAGVPPYSVRLTPAITFPFGAATADFQVRWELHRRTEAPGSRVDLTNFIHLGFRRCPDQNLAHNCHIAGMPDLPPP